jgi:hypothetical protein
VGWFSDKTVLGWDANGEKTPRKRFPWDGQSGQKAVKKHFKFQMMHGLM